MDKENLQKRYDELSEQYEELLELLPQHKYSKKTWSLKCYSVEFYKIIAIMTQLKNTR